MDSIWPLQSDWYATQGKHTPAVDVQLARKNITDCL